MSWVTNPPFHIRTMRLPKIWRQKKNPVYSENTAKATPTIPYRARPT
jgi:hypothetical protein